MKYAIALLFCLAACANPKRDIVEGIKREKAIIDSLKWSEIYTQQRQDAENKRIVQAISAYKKFDRTLFYRYADTLFDINQDVRRHNKIIDSLELELKAY